MIGGTILGGAVLQSSADKLNDPKDVKVNLHMEDESMESFDYAYEMANKGYLSEEEAKKVIELETKLVKIEDELETLYQKAEQNALYGELKENNVLSDDEIKKYMEAEKAINALYENVTEDSNFDELDKKADKIVEERKAIYDKVDVYFTNLDQMELDNNYDELLDTGDLTKEQVEQLEAADKKVDELYKNLPENPTEEELNELDKKVEAIYKGMDFLKDLSEEGCDITLY